MKTLAFTLPNPIALPKSQLSPPPLPPIPRIIKPLFKPRTQFCLPLRVASPNSPYGGWEDVRLGIDSLNPAESARDFLVSIGIYDKKHVFTFLLGLITAFSVSRVRVSSIIVFPASVFVFAVGFSVGFFRGGDVTANSRERNGNERALKVYIEKLRSLLGFFDRFDAKVGDLKDEVQRAIDSREIGLDDLEKFVDVTESMRLLALEARNSIGVSADGVGGASGEFFETQKSSSGKRKPIVEVGIEFLQFVGGLFGKGLVNPKANKVKEKDKENVKQGRVEGVVDHSLGDGLFAPSNKSFVNSAGNEIRDRGLGNSQGLGMGYALNWDKDERSRMGSRSMNVNYAEVDRNARRFHHREEHSYQNRKFRFADDEYVSWKMDQGSETETEISHDRFHDSSDSGVSMRHTETEASFVKRRMFKKSSRVSNFRMMSEEETYRFQSREGKEDDDMLMMEDEASVSDEIGSFSSVISEDIIFDRYLTEANNLLKEAKMCIKGRLDEEHAEFMLYKSAKLLTQATTMKPMSLLAVGQLGNTYLLHGELKLRISRELRTVLTKSGSSSVEIQRRIFKGLDDEVINKDKVASALVNVCEECEELLVEAGRKYRVALSIDRSDVRALYNWGLALSFRAQLIADIGPEAAFDADKMFMAAIDKFDAMMSKGNAYAPDALLRWGIALQQRSQLRPSNSKERLKLLQQAKRLYEDALHMDADNSQAREALLSCVSELNYRLR